MNELQVVIPYRDLVELLNAAKAVADLEAENQHIQNQMGALRNQFVELLEMLKDKDIL